MQWFDKLRRKNRPDIYILRDDNSKRLTLINNITKEKIQLVDDYGKLVNFTQADINFERVDQLENSQNAKRLTAPYGFYVDPFNNGVALVSWTLYPDGRYFEDEDGFGGENCNETTVYGYINTRGKVIIPFQDMDGEEIKQFREKAERCAGKLS